VQPLEPIAAGTNVGDPGLAGVAMRPLPCVGWRPHLWPWVVRCGDRGSHAAHGRRSVAASKLLGPNWTTFRKPRRPPGAVATRIDDGPDQTVTPRSTSWRAWRQSHVLLPLASLLRSTPQLAREIVSRGHSIRESQSDHLHRFSVLWTCGNCGRDHACTGHDRVRTGSGRDSPRRPRTAQSSPGTGVARWSCGSQAGRAGDSIRSIPTPASYSKTVGAWTARRRHTSASDGHAACSPRDSCHSRGPPAPAAGSFRCPTLRRHPAGQRHMMRWSFHICMSATHNAVDVT